MVVVFWLFILLALACIVFSVYRYKQGDNYRFSKAEQNHELYLYEKGSKIFVTLKGVKFSGNCQIEPSETTYRVTSVTMALNSSEMMIKKITRDDLYKIEEQLYTRYPSAKLIWGHPMIDLLKTL